jgi:hypothetical protein
MTESLARFRVTEPYGIRRFLYPITATVPVEALGLAAGELERCTIVSSSGVPIPTQIEKASLTIHAGVSLEPFADEEFSLVEGVAPAPFDDPLRIKILPDGGLRNDQKRFSISVDAAANIARVIYSGQSHLSAPTAVTRNGETTRGYVTATLGPQPLLSLVTASGQYPDGCLSTTKLELTACKSWATIRHRLQQPMPGDEVRFVLPWPMTADVLTCDFGVGNGIFGKLERGVVDEVVWSTRFGSEPYAHWEIRTAGRLDYAGGIAQREQFASQRYFHVIDKRKSLAVAITQIPDACERLIVQLERGGAVTVSFLLGETVVGPAEFGLCVHFLDAHPAIAAATNPQSILLPPIVDMV